MSIGRNSKDLLESIVIVADDCDFVSRPRITMLTKTLCSDLMWLGRNACSWVGAMEPPSRLHIRMAMLMIVAGWAILDETEGCHHPAGFGVTALDRL